MFRLNEIRDQIFQRDWWPKAQLLLKRLLKVSESPAGFTALAAVGLSFVLLLQLGDGNEPVTPPQALEEHQPDVSPMEASTEKQAAPLAEPPEPSISDPESQPLTYSLRRNETLIGLLRRAGISNSEAHKAVNALKDVTNLRRLQRGQEVRLIADAGALQSLRMRDSFGEEAVLKAIETGYRAERHNIPTLTLTHLVEGEITDSLYLSAQRAGLPTPVIVELIRLMSFDVDFEREIRQGDRFQVYFERDYAPEFGDLAEGRILQLKLELQKRTLEASYFEDETGHGDYFDPDGNSTRKALMKTPLDVTVVTSSYGRRKHPVLGYTRMHKGVDFRARTGTPIMAAGDGVVERASRYGSYGNYIRIRHNSTYKTAYAHLSRYGRGIKAGVRVKQGQVIGYAGATGRVSAAHLHYEVLVNGQQANPLTLKLPTGRVLAGEQLTAFQTKHAGYLADISQVKSQQQMMVAFDANDIANPSPDGEQLARTADR